MKTVKFLVPMENYRIDDTASFKDEVANKLIEKGFAVEVQEEQKAAKTK